MKVQRLILKDEGFPAPDGFNVGAPGFISVDLARRFNKKVVEQINRRFSGEYNKFKVDMESK